MTTKIYSLQNLDCANCAAKIERKASAIDGVNDLSITFSTMQMRITAEDPDSLIPEVLKAAQKIEPDIIITEYSHNTNHSHNHSELSHNDDNSCGCDGHDHHHNDGDSCGCSEHHHHHDDNDDDCGCGGHSHNDDCGGHSHNDDCGCGGHSHNNSHHHSHNETNDTKKDIIEIILGAVCFAAGMILENRFQMPSIIFFVIAYLTLGHSVLLKAAKNISRGQIFDENFLMSIATLGAFAIQNFAEGCGVMLFYRIGELFEDIAVAKSRSQIIEAIDMRPETVNLVLPESDSIKIIPSEEAVRGDILLVRPGDRIPLDGIITEGETRIDTSPVTGEPVPVKAVTGSSVTSGCINTSGVIKIRVENRLEESMVTKILNSVENAAASKPKIDRFITKFARIYTPFVVAVALITAIVPSIITGDWHKWIYTALSFLVISCPCALVLSVPLAFFSGIGAGSKKGILFKGGLSIEALNNVKTVVMDKTGTITKGDFSVQKVVSLSKYSENELLSYAAACELNSVHPIGCSIVEAVKSKNLDIYSPLSAEEISGHGIRAEINSHTVLCGNRKLMDNFGVSVSSYSNDAFGSEVLIAVDGRLAGYIVISDTVKPEAASAIAKIKKMKISTAMLTGDSEESAESIARTVGINEVHARLLPEDKLTRLSEIRGKNGAVMFVGDGINDAPVLAGADVGAAMGSGADAAIEAADVVFMQSDMESIPRSIAISKATAFISRENVIFALVIKAAFMILGLTGFASMWMAVFADTGVAMICILNSIRILYKKY